MSSARPSPSVAAQKAPAADEESYVARVRWLIWMYFFLLVFEGSLRKWIFPQLSAPLLVARDPVVLLAYALSIRAGKFPKGPFVFTCFILAGLSIALSLFGSGTLLVTLFGLHADFLHLPMIFLMAQVLRAEDVKYFGYAILLLAVPTIILMTLQFLAEPDSILNRGTLGADSGQIGSALGRIRPAAFYSYNTGVGQYLALLSAITFTGLLTREFRLWIVVLAGICILLGVSISGSRTTVISVGLVLAFVIIIWVLQPKSVGRAPAIVLCVLVVGTVVPRFSVFRQGLEVLQTRTEDASENDPLLSRLAYNFIPTAQIPFLGYGIGVGTNVASAALTGELKAGELNLLLAEAEWPRLLLESGPLVGTAIILWRVLLVFYLVVQSYRALRGGDFLPWVLSASAAPIVFTGNFGQSSTLGFATFASGLCLASLSRKAKAMPVSTSPFSKQVRPLVRGRSRLAERLTSGEEP